MSGPVLRTRVQNLTRRISIGIMSLGLLGIGACLDSEILTRFREAYTPGLVAGLSTAVTDPSNAEAGLRQTAVALFDGIGAILTPNSSTDSGG